MSEHTPTQVAGRTEVRERVLRTVAREASASIIGVSRDAVNVEVAEQRAGFAVSVRSPIPVPNLADTDAVAAATPVIEQARSIQERLQQRLTTLLGREVVRLNLTVVGATVPERKRVR